jgi:hypothetical protein
MLMENDRGTEETWTDWEGGGRSTQIGMFVGLAVGAGVLLLILRKIFAPKPKPAEQLTDRLASQAAALLGDEPLAAGRDLLTQTLSQTVLPEIKPVLRALLREIEASVSQGFKRADRAIDEL